VKIHDETRTILDNGLLAVSVSLAALLTLAASARSEELKDPLSPLSANGEMLCFRRDYTPEHLAQHPAQTIKSVLLAFQHQGLVDIVLTTRRSSLKQIAAGCGWRKGAGIDTSDRKMIPDFNKSAGLDCIVTVGGSAEEGGYLLIDPAQDAKNLTLFLQSPITTFNDQPDKPKGYDLALGREDRTFALSRISANECERFRATKE
jgi:hypothetical protein